MKTTIEVPDSAFRQAKTRAAARGVILRQLSTQAIEEQIRRCTCETCAVRMEAPWMAGFGMAGFGVLSDENRRILSEIEQVFESISSEDFA